MPRKLKPETVIANLRRSLRDALLEASEERRSAWAAEGRATKAEEDCAEWKRRFDILLARTPIVPVKGDDHEPGK